jgi:hypothetical protein
MLSERSTVARARASSAAGWTGGRPLIPGSRWLRLLEPTGACRRLSAWPSHAGHVVCCRPPGCCLLWGLQGDGCLPVMHWMCLMRLSPPGYGRPTRRHIWHTETVCWDMSDGADSGVSRHNVCPYPRTRRRRPSHSSQSLQCHSLGTLLLSLMTHLSHGLPFSRTDVALAF